MGAGPPAKQTGGWSSIPMAAATRLTATASSSVTAPSTIAGTAVSRTIRIQLSSGTFGPEVGDRQAGPATRDGEGEDPELMVSARRHADEEPCLHHRSAGRIEEAGEPSSHGLACRVLGGDVERAIGPRTTDGTERREDSLVHRELEPLRRERLVEDPLHPVDVQSLRCRNEGMRHRIRCGRRRVDRPIAGRPACRRRLAGE